MSFPPFLSFSSNSIPFCRAVGRMIISEVCLPLDQKVIQPVTIGGSAGGEKYVVHNILFKFALDSGGLFGGSDLAARKGKKCHLKTF